MRSNLFIFLALLLVMGFLSFLFLNSSTKPNLLKTEIEIVQNLQTLPAFQAQDLNKKFWTDSDLKNKFTLLHFWASWCAPCVVELPKLIQLAKDEPSYLVLAISSDNDLKSLNRFLEKQNLKNLPQNFVIILDEHKKLTQDLFQTFKLPETILVNKKGQMVQKIAGDADWNSSNIRARLKALQE